jgi:hypothetical protein
VGDLIGRIFANGQCFIFGSFMKNTEVAKKIVLCTFPKSLDYALILAKNELGNILGDFFANSSGHPVLIG